MLHAAFPDPYAIIKLNGIEVASTAVYKKSVNPNWNENLRLWVHSLTIEAKTFTYTFCSYVTKQSLIKVDIFDAKKEKNVFSQNCGYLGSIEFQVWDVIDDIHDRSGL